MTYEEAEKLMKWNYDWDWEKFRREAAKDILAGMLSHHRIFYDEGLRPEHVRMAISYTDELIKQLKGD